MSKAELAQDVRGQTHPWRFVLGIIADIAPCTELELLEVLTRDVYGPSHAEWQTTKFLRLQQYLSEFKRLGFVVVDQGKILITPAGRHFLSQPSPEPTMEEILASIRRIISEDESSSAREHTVPQNQAEEEVLESGEGEADDEIINDIARV